MSLLMAAARTGDVFLFFPKTSVACMGTGSKLNAKAQLFFFYYLKQQFIWLKCRKLLGKLAF